MTCTFCHRTAPPAGAVFCCERAELHALRAAVDQAINVLGSEVEAPLVISDEGATRRVVEHAIDSLRAARRAA